MFGNPQSEIPNPKLSAPITDSPWFWPLLFSSTALAALVAIGGKYGQRQARLERQYQARERVTAGDRGDEAVASAEGGAERRPYATPDATLIPLWPLGVFFAAVVVVAAVMLFRSRCRTSTNYPRPELGSQAVEPGQPGSPVNEASPR